jgi:hypothetical protein
VPGGNKTELAKSDDSAQKMTLNASDSTTEDCPLYGWVELQMRGADGAPVPHAAYEIDAGGKTLAGKLDGDGRVREKVKPGACKVRFPMLDGAAWELASSSADGPQEMRPRTDAKTPDPPPAPADYTLKEGESLASVAFKFGFVPATIWKHASNEELRIDRGDPSSVFAGDQVHVPERAKKEVSVQSGQIHSFKRLGYPACIRLQLLDGGKPRANERVELTVDGEKRNVETDGDGTLFAWVRPDAREGRVVMKSDGAEVKLAFAKLAPINEVRGVQQRLEHLGFECDKPGEWGDKTQLALELFQTWSGVEETGLFDEETRKALLALHDEPAAKGKNKKGGTRAQRATWISKIPTKET